MVIITASCSSSIGPSGSDPPIEADSTQTPAEFAEPTVESTESLGRQVDADLYLTALLSVCRSDCRNGDRPIVVGYAEGVLLTPTVVHGVLPLAEVRVPGQQYPPLLQRSDGPVLYKLGLARPAGSGFFVVPVSTTRFSGPAETATEGADFRADDVVLTRTATEWVRVEDPFSVGIPATTAVS